MRIHIGEFRLLNKFVRPEEALDMIANNFIRQVRSSVYEHGLLCATIITLAAV